MSEYCIYDVIKQETFIHKKMAKTKWERIAEEDDIDLCWKYNHVSL